MSQYNPSEREVNQLLTGDTPDLDKDIPDPTQYIGSTQTYFTRSKKQIEYPDGTTLEYLARGEEATAGEPILRTGFSYPNGVIEVRENAVDFQTYLTPEKTTREFITQRVVAHEHLHNLHPKKSNESDQAYERRIEQKTYNWLHDRDVSLEGYYELLKTRDGQQWLQAD
jgi:hypothetical protein